tara:strand:- start:1238 stop:1759 length:522 start_codon:yes stop_codon:yes gene_type:complete
MKKIFFILFTFALVSQPLIACDFKVINFGDNKDKLVSKSPSALVFENQFGGENAIVPITDVCKNDKNLEGTKLDYLFMNNKLVLITLLRGNMDDTAILDFAMLKYGSFNLPIGTEKNNWKGSYVWEVGNDVINYVRTDIHQGNAELLEVSSKLYYTDLNEYLDEVGKWFDSQE